MPSNSWNEAKLRMDVCDLEVCMEDDGLRIDWITDTDNGTLRLVPDEHCCLHIETDGMDTYNDKSFTKKILDCLINIAIVDN